MTTKKATELIKKDIKCYKKRISSADESRNEFFKKFGLDNSEADSTTNLAKAIYKLLDSIYKDQIKCYEGILKELESKKK